MEYMTAGGVVIFSSLIGVGTALMKRLQPLTALTFCDAIFTAIIGCSLVARTQDWIDKDWDLVVFCAALSHAQHSSLNLVAFSHGIRGIKLASLVTLSWAVPASWTTLFVTLPQSCNQNQHLIFLMVQKIYSVVQKYNRTRRIFDDIKPAWFEEKYDEDVYDEILDQRNEQNITNTTSAVDAPVTVHFPAVNMTLVPPVFSHCEEPTLLFCLVFFVFLSYVLPILLISTFREKASDMQKLVMEHTKTQQQRPIPRPRSAPPCITPRQNYARARSQLSTALHSTGVKNTGLMRLLIFVSGIVFIPGLTISLLHVQNYNTTRVLQLSATCLHAIFRTAVNARLITTTRVHPT